MVTVPAPNERTRQAALPVAAACPAAETRARIREAAGPLFVERGYTGTTLRDVAEEAGVGERTLYDAFSTKAALFGHTLGVATVGDEEPIPVAECPEVRAARERRSPHAVKVS